MPQYHCNIIYTCIYTWCVRNADAVVHILCMRVIKQRDILVTLHAWPGNWLFARYVVPVDAILFLRCESVFVIVGNIVAEICSQVNNNQRRSFYKRQARCRKIRRLLTIRILIISWTLLPYVAWSNLDCCCVKVKNIVNKILQFAELQCYAKLYKFSVLSLNNELLE